jgi:hypothetical protein
MSQEIIVLHFRVGQEPEQVTITNELAEFQRLVGGYIEAVHLQCGLLLICNEEGLLIGALPNRMVEGGIYHGDFFICRQEGAEFAGVQPGDLDRIRYSPRITV